MAWSAETLWSLAAALGLYDDGERSDNRRRLQAVRDQRAVLFPLVQDLLNLPDSKPCRISLERHQDIYTSFEV